MPLSMPMDSPPVQSTDAQYPATTKQAAAIIDSIHTIVTCTNFKDKILVTITQDGRLAQWVIQEPNLAPNEMKYAESCKSRSMLP